MSQSEIDIRIAYNLNFMRSLMPIWALIAIGTVGVFLS
jgi:hypothetical protein